MSIGISMLIVYIIYNFHIERDEFMRILNTRTMTILTISAVFCILILYRISENDIFMILGIIQIILVLILNIIRRFFLPIIKVKAKIVKVSLARFLLGSYSVTFLLSDGKKLKLEFRESWFSKIKVGDLVILEHNGLDVHEIKKLKTPQTKVKKTTLPSINNNMAHPSPSKTQKK